MSDAETLDPTTAAVRRRLMQYLLDTGTGPTAQELAAAASIPETEVQTALRALAEHHIIVLEPETGAVRMAHPFSAIPTAFPVRAGTRRWWGNCIWDALGIAALVEEDVTIDTPCPDCGDPLSLQISADHQLAGEGTVHFAVPAARWYEDIFDT